MASIINATTTNGVAISADNSGILQLATNSGTTALTLSVAQAATFVSSVTATSLTAPILSSATTLSLQTNGSTTAVTIDASQNVGIGTASPAAKLDVQGQLRSTTAAGTAPTFYLSQAVTSAWSITSPASTNALAFTDAQYSAERMRIDSTGNVLVGTTASTGLNTNTSKVVGGVFSTASGSVSSANNVAITIFTVPAGVTNWVYLVSADVLSGTPTLYSVVYLVTSDNGVLRATALQSATMVTISVSGLNIQATQASGGAQPIPWTVTRVS